MRRQKEAGVGTGRSRSRAEPCSNILFSPPSKARSKFRALFFPIAIGSTPWSLAGVVVAQYWTVDPVPEPPIQVSFLTAAAAASAAAAAAAAAGARSRRWSRDKPVEIPIEPVQPIEIPEEIPEAPDRARRPGRDGRRAGRRSGWRAGRRARRCAGRRARRRARRRSGRRPGEGEILRVVGNVKKPEVINRVQPVYTEIARRARIQGVVIVEAIINTEGNVTDVRVLKSLPDGADGGRDRRGQAVEVQAGHSGRPAGERLLHAHRELPAAVVASDALDNG